MWNSIRISRYDPRVQSEENDDGGLRGKPNVIAAENPDFADPLSIAVVDAKSVFDASSSEQAAGDDDRTALEIAVIQGFTVENTWPYSMGSLYNENPADILTKLFQAHENSDAAVIEEVYMEDSAGRRNFSRRATTYES